jgi:phage terminase large subunit-like protein
LFRALPTEEKEQRLAELDEEKLRYLKYDWKDWLSRPDQRIPVTEPAWIVWLILAGRGWGKTRTGSETCRAWIKQGYEYVNLIGATADDARDIMIEGESGILAVCPKNERPIYKKSDRQLVWPNGAKSLIFTADEPERLRGKQHMKLWCDELCAWRYMESWDQASFGLRLGDNPQAVVTTTPKPTKELKDLVKDPTTYITKGVTNDNFQNLAPAFINKIISKYVGTRLGRQELNAEILDDNPGALWKRSWLDDLRVKSHPTLKRIVVAIDPAAKSNENSDDTGIVVAGIGVDNHGYILEDLTMKGRPEEWARCAVNAYHRLMADRIIGETNNGGEMIEYTIRTIDKNVSFKEVTASRGKITRAEPISALYEQKKVHHVGSFPLLEDQMCEYDPKTAKFSPDRMDALVWALTELMAEIDVGATAMETMEALLKAQLAARNNQPLLPRR